MHLNYTFSKDRIFQIFLVLVKMTRDFKVIPLDSCSPNDSIQPADLYRRLQLVMELNHRCLNRIISVRFLRDKVICEVERKHYVFLQDIIDGASFTVCPLSKTLIHSVFLDLLGLATYLFTITDEPDILAMFIDSLEAPFIALDDYGYSSVSLLQGLRCSPAPKSNRRNTRTVYSRLIITKLASILQDMFLAHASTNKERERIYRNLSEKRISFTATGDDLILDFAFRSSKYTLIKLDSQDQSLYKDPKIIEIQSAMDYFRGLSRDLFGETPLMQALSKDEEPNSVKNVLHIDYNTTRFVARNGHTALFIAVLKNRISAVVRLRFYEARMRMASSLTICGHLLSHITALHLAVSLHRHEIIALLAPYEARLQDTLMQFTPLHIAVFTGDLHAIQLLSPYAAGLTDKNGWTAFIWCAYLDNKCGLCELLPLEGNDESLKLALHAAMSVKSTTCAEFLSTILNHVSVSP